MKKRVKLGKMKEEKLGTFCLGPIGKWSAWQNINCNEKEENLLFFIIGDAGSIK